MESELSAECGVLRILAVPLIHFKNLPTMGAAPAIGSNLNLKNSLWILIYEPIQQYRMD
jgi:hypothetical protein